MGAVAAHGKIGIAIGTEDKGLAFGQSAIVTIIGIDRISFACTISYGDGETRKSDGIGTAIIGSGDIGNIIAIV